MIKIDMLGYDLVGRWDSMVEETMFIVGNIEVLG